MFVAQLTVDNFCFMLLIDVSLRLCNSGRWPATQIPEVGTNQDSLQSQEVHRLAFSDRGACPSYMPSQEPGCFHFKADFGKERTCLSLTKFVSCDKGRHIDHIKVPLSNKLLQTSKHN